MASSSPTCLLCLAVFLHILSLKHFSEDEEHSINYGILMWFKLTTTNKPSKFTPDKGNNLPTPKSPPLSGELLFHNSMINQIWPKYISSNKFTCISSICQKTTKIKTHGPFLFTFPCDT